INQRVEEIKVMVEGPMPEKCYQPVPDGKTENMKLPAGCAYCQFKHECYPDLRTFLYASGPKYLTKVVSAPRVVEVLEDF
ncbi:MAG: hypothetical protein ACR2PH_00845, partial [Desulfobulbia bacterium]